MLTLTYDQLTALRPCVDSARPIIRALGGKARWKEPVNAGRLREAGADCADMVWLAEAMSARDRDIARRLKLWMADCAAHVLRIFERDNANDAPRKAIIAARQFARGEIDAAAMDAASDAANAAAWAVSMAASDASDAAMASAWGASDASDAPASTAWAARAAARAAAGDAAGAAEEAWQFDRLIARLSDPEPDDWPLPARTIVEAA